MLTNQDEIDCVKEAWEPGIADPTRSRAGFHNILSCFFTEDRIRGTKILDLGPGHYDFGELAAELGATVIGYELDPAVIKLGEMKGFSVIEGNVYDVEKLNSLRGTFDGMLCRGSFNSRNLSDPEDHRAYLDALISVVKDDGFLWISPCNDPIGDLETDEDFQRIVDEQIKFFTDNDFDMSADDDEFISAFGLSSTPPKLLFTRGLDFDVDRIRKELAPPVAPVQASPAENQSIARRMVGKLSDIFRR